MAKAISSIIDSLFVQAHDDWRLTLVKNWAKFAGPLHKRVRVEKVDKDVLVLGVYDTHWMQELYLLSRTICSQLNHALGAPHIREVRLKLVEARKALQEKVSPTGGLLEFTEHAMSPAELRALASIKDPDLREALRIFLNRAMRKRDVSKTC